MAELNHTGAFATVTPATMNVAEMMFDKQKMDLLNRKEERERAQQEEELQKEKDKKLQEIAKYNAKFKPYDTGSVSYNTAIVSALNEVKEKSLELWNVANDRKRSSEERSNAWMQLNDLQNYPEKLKLVSDRWTEAYQTYQDAKQKGVAFENPEFEKLFQQGFKGMKIMMDDNLNPSTVFLDKNGDGISDFATYDEVQKMIPQGFIMPKINYNAQMDAAAKVLGTSEVKDEKGFVTTVKKEVPLGNIKQYAASLLFDNGTYSPLVLSRARELGMDYKNITEQNFETIKNSVINDIKARTDVKNEKDIDYGAMNANARLNFDKSQARKKDQKDNPVFNLQDVKITTVVSKADTQKGGRLEGVPVNSFGANMQGVNLSRNIGDGKEVVESMYLSPDKKTLYLAGVRNIGTTTVTEGDEGQTKTKSTKSNRFVYSSKNQAGVVGDFMLKFINPQTNQPINSIQEAIEYLKDDMQRKGLSKNVDEYGVPIE